LQPVNVVLDARVIRLNKKMLKQRLLTAIILIPLMIWLLSLSSIIFASVLSIFLILGAWEWAGLCAWQAWKTRFVYATLACLMLPIVYTFRQQPAMMAILFFVCLWWLLAGLWLWRYQQGYKMIFTSPFIKAVLGLIILLSTFFALLHLHEHERYGGQWVMFLFVLIWTADSGAYFMGKRWGKTKLADKISPGKTWEGVLGALLMSSIVSLSYALFKSMSLMTLLLFMLLCLLTVIVSILGDLLESVLKRQAGIKDSSQILPGHGGILDRIDSLTSASPIFVMGLVSLGHLF
jgi:phosphatidate cytidylyltransferase